MFGFPVLAQDTILHHYEDGQVSAKFIPTRWNADSSRWLVREVKIYTIKGQSIWSGTERVIAGSAYVNLSFHPNGGVKTLKYNSQPDGGIQRYEETLKLDSSGVIIFKQTFQNEHPFSNPLRQEKAFCSVLHSVEYSILNQTDSVIHIEEKSVTAGKSLLFEITYFSDNPWFLSKNYALNVNREMLYLKELQSDTIQNGVINRIRFHYR